MRPTRSLVDRLLPSLSPAKVEISMYAAMEATLGLHVPMVE